MLEKIDLIDERQMIVVLAASPEIGCRAETSELLKIADQVRLIEETWFRDEMVVALDLEQSYEQACSDLWIA